MEFTVTTRYDGRAMAALARGLRKTVRKNQRFTCAKVRQNIIFVNSSLILVRKKNHNQVCF